MKSGSTVLTITMFAFFFLYPCYLIPCLVSLNHGEWAVPQQHTLHCLMTAILEHAEMLPAHYLICPYPRNHLDNLSGERLTNQLSRWLKKSRNTCIWYHFIIRFKGVAQSSSIPPHYGRQEQILNWNASWGVWICSNLYCVLSFDIVKSFYRKWPWLFSLGASFSATASTCNQQVLKQLK